MPYTSERFIKSYPGYIGSPVWADDGVFKLYHYCLYKASHNRYPWRKLIVNPGELPVSLRHIAEELNWSKSKTEKKLRILQEIGFVSVISSNQGTIIRISDWDTLQGSSAYRAVCMDPQVPNGACTENQDTHVPEISPRPDNQPTRVPEIRTRTENQPTRVPEISPYQYSKENKDTQYYKRPHPEEPEGFTQLWLAYPVDRRTYRETAADLYSEALQKGATPGSIIAALEADKQSETWLKESGRFIPGIVKWLQRESWRNHLTQEAPEEEEEWITR